MAVIRVLKNKKRRYGFHIRLFESVWKACLYSVNIIPCGNLVRGALFRGDDPMAVACDCLIGAVLNEPWMIGDYSL